MEMVGSVVAVYGDHNSAEAAVKKLIASGFETTNLSVVGKGYHKDEKVVGFYTTGVLAYETAIKADDFLVMARGSTDETARAKTILATTNPSRLDVHEGSDEAKASKPLVDAS